MPQTCGCNSEDEVTEKVAKRLPNLKPFQLSKFGNSKFGTDVILSRAGDKGTGWTQDRGCELFDPRHKFTPFV